MNLMPKMKANEYLDLSGNIFVDQGQYTLQNLLNLAFDQRISIKKIEELKNSNEIYGTKWISENLINFKSFTINFTTNHMRMQSSFKPENSKLFKAFLDSLIDGIIAQYDENIPKVTFCDICGMKHSFNFDQEYRRVLQENYSKYNPKKEEPKFSCREFFPLAGSMGSESQSFSNMSIAPNICPRCLFIVNYLPFSALMIEGKLAIFQAHKSSIQYDITKQIIAYYLDQIETISSTNKINNLGTKIKNKNQLIFERLFEYFEGLLPNPPTKDDYRNNFPSKNFSIWLWKYSNSGQNPAIEIESIPNTLILFIYLCDCLDLKNSLIDILRTEVKKIKNPRRQFYESTKYNKLYEFEKSYSNKDLSNKLILFLYYLYVMNYSKSEILCLIKIVNDLKNRYKKDIEKELKKRSFILINQTIRNLLKTKEIDFYHYRSIFAITLDEEKYLKSRKMILQMINLDVLESDFQHFEELINNFFEKEAKKVFRNIMNPELTNLEKFVLQISLAIYNYFKNKYNKTELNKTIIKNRLKYANLNWFSTIFSKIALSGDGMFNFVNFQYLLDKAGSWYKLKNILRNLFILFNENFQQFEDNQKFEIDIPKGVKLQYKNDLIDKTIGEYLKLRIEQKGSEYVTRNFIIPFINGKISIKNLFYLLELHKERLSFTPDIWEEMLVDPKKNKQDLSYFTQYIRIFIANYSNRLKIIEDFKILEEISDEVSEENFEELKEEFEELGKNNDLYEGNFQENIEK